MFRVGDYVRALETIYGIKRGKVYKVTESGSTLISVTENGNYEHDGIYASRFELYKNKKNSNVDSY